MKHPKIKTNCIDSALESPRYPPSNKSKTGDDPLGIVPGEEVNLRGFC